MIIQYLQEAKVRYENQKDEILQQREELYQLRSSFVKYFDRNHIQDMDIHEFVLGREKPKKGFNFCYTLEYKLVALGNISGGTPIKFGVYYGRTKYDNNKTYRFAKKYGDTYQEAFENVKKSILQLLDAGENEDTGVIAENILSPMFKGKILSIYYINRYLNIFSSEHLNHYLTKLDLNTLELSSSDAVYKRETLLAFKNRDPVMKKWPVDLFSHFLWTEYPCVPPK